MRHSTKTSVKQLGSYHNPQLEEHIEKEHSRLFLIARDLGIRMGIIRSADEAPSLSVITESIYSGYNELMTFAHKENQSILEIAHGALDIARHEKEQKRLINLKAKAESKWKISEQRLGDNRASNAPYYMLGWGIFLALMVILFDLVYISSGFQATGEPLYKSVLMGLGISVALAVIGILGSGAIQLIKSKWKQGLCYAGLFTLVASGLYVICHIRSEYYYQLTGKVISPWQFLLLNLLALVAFHFIAKMMIVPAWQKIKELRELRRRQKEVQHNKQEYQNLEAVMTDNELKNEENKKFKLSMLSYGQSTEERIQRMYESSLAEFKRAYMQESGGTTPLCFSQPPGILKTYYSEYSIFNKVNTKQ